MTNPLLSDPNTSAPASASDMPRAPLSLTLILAATPALGIGKAGGLPWPQLRKEMGFFKRVTMRCGGGGKVEGGRGRRRCNAVVMGRKTWDSIPERFRPLGGRMNVVVTKTPGEFEERLGKGVEGAVEGPIAVGSVSEALRRLQGLNSSSTVGDGDAQGRLEIDRVFVVGGATIYDAALELPQTERVLLTKIREEFECDTFFSVDLDKSEGWRRCSREALEEFTGEGKESGGEVEEKGVRFEFGMYERVGGREGR